MPTRRQRWADSVRPSMKVPPKRKGNLIDVDAWVKIMEPLNESPSEKEGKCSPLWIEATDGVTPLNESPSEKEGKCRRMIARLTNQAPSMKVPPKRKGNPDAPANSLSFHETPQ